MPQLPAQIDDSSVVQLALEQRLVDLYAPSSSLPRSSSSTAWTTRAVATTDRGDALQIALFALALSRVGQQAGNEGMLARGRIAYGQSLQAVRTAIADPRLVLRDQTLAASQVLRNYEVRSCD